MSSGQVWSKDSAGNLVYWTGHEWIHPTWSQDSAGVPVFWSPHHRQWLRVERNPAPAAQPPPKSTPEYYGGSGSGSGAGVGVGAGAGIGRLPVPTYPDHTYTTAGTSALSPSGSASSVAGLTARMSSMRIGSLEPTFETRTDQTGVTEYIVTSQTKKTQSKFEKGPAHRITDPQALAVGLTADKKFKGTGDTRPEAYEHLDGRFQVRKEPRKFFKFGRVLMMLHAEPAGDKAGSAVTAVTKDARWGEDFYIKPRRFVVVNPGQNSCIAIAIGTYGSQGVAKKGVRKSDHAIVFSGRDPPTPTKAELPSRTEQPMKPQRIRIDMNDRRNDALDGMSRLNFGKVYTIEHNVKVRDLGMVNRNSVGDLWSVFWSVQMEYASRQGPQSAKLFQSAKKALATRPRNDSVGDPSLEEEEEEEEEEDDEDEEEEESDVEESDDGEDDD